MTAWRREPFDAVITDESGGNLKTPRSGFSPSGRYPIIDQGKDLIAGYTDDESRLCHATLPVIVFGDHTRSFKYVDFPFCMGADGVKVLRPKLETDVKYLYYYLRQLRLTDGGYDRHFKYLKRSTIVLPPLAEQHRIAEILDKADELRTKRRAAIAQLDTLTRSIFLDMFGDPITNPKGWPTESLTSVCYCYSGGTPSKSNTTYWDGHLPWFSPKDLKRDDLFDSEDHVNETVLIDTNLKLLPPNTVVIVVRGMILAHTFPVSVIRVPATINQDLKALLPVKSVELDSQFLAHCLRVQSDAILSYVSESAHGTKRLDAEALSKIRVLLPPTKSQRHFSRAVARVEACKVAALESLRCINMLFDALQHRAFLGAI